ncbi:hypothetical protein GLOTRDRAFT_123333 [Gloeophyllum trabeum ATCC 11539]|uniref:Pentacotripeptide-repeat region of PRORP domain-containing protein n=1 Tax=Gloeophyllum trabeum (strain ATCC 11539 / FP-39264 / Madison 617) TaxID=670483 RepID=S7RA01_GLOTA|nr:uncharacterized protein GLOTRDRAFT_123333 [Gloeophyllum trabeum ATCC 11539]EPQ51075.1 hypothetical protein GLOTRDRAFT_123333 [Gloeophyllum trabeum ATCC 11539]
MDTEALLKKVESTLEASRKDPPEPVAKRPRGRPRKLVGQAPSSESVLDTQKVISNLTSVFSLSGEHSEPSKAIAPVSPSRIPQFSASPDISSDSNVETTESSGDSVRALPEASEAKVHEILRRDHTRDPDRREKSLTIYLYYRGVDRLRLSTLPRAVFIQAAKMAAELGRLDTLDDISRDLLEWYEGDKGKVDKEARCETISKFLTMFSEDGLLKHATVLALFDAWVDAGQHGALSQNALNRVMEALLATHLNVAHAYSPYAPVALRFIELLMKHASTARGDPTLTEGPHKRQVAVNYQPPLAVEKLFTLVRAYITLEHHDVALDIFQRLVVLSFIPRNAIQHAEGIYDKSKDFRLIVLSALVKACLQWQWRIRAVPFMADLIQSYSVLNEEIRTITEELLEKLLEKPTVDCLIAAQRLASLFITRTTPDLPLSDYFVSRIYLQAGELRLAAKDDATNDTAADAAVEMYGVTQRSGNLAKHAYPPPDGRVVRWLLRHLTLKVKNMDYARKLVQQIADSPEDLPVHVRADVISIAASNGFASAARKLWDRYAEDILPSGDLSTKFVQQRRSSDTGAVSGSPPVAVRMVSLFVNLADKEAKRTKDLKSRLRGLSAAPSSSELRLGGSAPKTNSQDQTLEQIKYRESRHEDFKAFAQHVAESFRQHLEPLEKADHLHLNALARIHFRLGQSAEGFDIFKIMIKRQEIPDTYDVNVALTMLAKHNVRAAARVVDAMVKKGLRPDGVTFGTVMSAGMAAGDLELVDWLLGLAADLDVGISMKGVTAGIHASVTQSMNSDPPERLRSNLNAVMKMIRASRHQSYLPTPNTGKLCVNASLKAESAELAFEFWRMLLRGRAEWEDYQHVGLRFRIANRTRQEVVLGRMTQGRAKEMVELLGLSETHRVGTWRPKAPDVLPQS